MALLLNWTDLIIVYVWSVLRWKGDSKCNMLMMSVLFAKSGVLQKSHRGNGMGTAWKIKGNIDDTFWSTAWNILLYILWFEYLLNNFCVFITKCVNMKSKVLIFVNIRVIIIAQLNYKWILVCFHFFIKQESPPAWTQEAYCPPCIEHSFCCPNWVPPQQGTPLSWPGWGELPYLGTPQQSTPLAGYLPWQGTPPGRVPPQAGYPPPAGPGRVPPPITLSHKIIWYWNSGLRDKLFEFFMIGVSVRLSGGNFWRIFFCSSLCKDLSDNLTETPIVKNSIVCWLFQFYALRLLWVTNVFQNVT